MLRSGKERINMNQSDDDIDRDRDGEGSTGKDSKTEFSSERPIELFDVGSSVNNQKTVGSGKVLSSAEVGLQDVNEFMHANSAESVLSSGGGMLNPLTECHDVVQDEAVLTTDASRILALNRGGEESGHSDREISGVDPSSTLIREGRSTQGSLPLDLPTIERSTMSSPVINESVINSPITADTMHVVRVLPSPVIVMEPSVVNAPHTADREMTTSEMMNRFAQMMEDNKAVIEGNRIVLQKAINERADLSDGRIERALTSIRMVNDRVDGLTARLDSAMQETNQQVDILKQQTNTVEQNTQRNAGEIRSIRKDQVSNLAVTRQEVKDLKAIQERSEEIQARHTREIRTVDDNCHARREQCEVLIAVQNTRRIELQEEVIPALRLYGTQITNLEERVTTHQTENNTFRDSVEMRLTEFATRIKEVAKMPVRHIRTPSDFEPETSGSSDLREAAIHGEHDNQRQLIPRPSNDDSTVSGSAHPCANHNIISSRVGTIAVPLQADGGEGSVGQPVSLPADVVGTGESNNRYTPSLPRPGFTPKIMARVRIEEMPTFVGASGIHPLEFLDRLKRYFRMRNADLEQYLDEVAYTLVGEPAQWYEMDTHRPRTFSEFEERLLARYWNRDTQRMVRENITRNMYRPGPGNTRAGHFRYCAGQLQHMRPIMDEEEIVSLCIGLFEEDIVRILRAHNSWDIQSLAAYLESIEQTRSPVVATPTHPKGEPRNGTMINCVERSDNNAGSNGKKNRKRGGPWRGKNNNSPPRQGNGHGGAQHPRLEEPTQQATPVSAPITPGLLPSAPPATVKLTASGSSGN